MVLHLDEPGFNKRMSPLSVGAWHRMVEKGLAPEKSELLRGVIVKKIPKSILHIQLVGRLFLMLQSLVGHMFWVRQEASMTLADSEPEPDISVVVGRDIDYRAHPASARLVVEVSISSLAEDRELAGIYAEAGVDEYRIIHGPTRTLEIYRTPSAGRYQDILICKSHDVAESKSLPGVTVKVEDLFAEIA